MMMHTAQKSRKRLLLRLLALLVLVVVVVVDPAFSFTPLLGSSSLSIAVMDSSFGAAPRPNIHHCRHNDRVGGGDDGGGGGGGGGSGRRTAVMHATQQQQQQQDEDDDEDAAVLVTTTSQKEAEEAAAEAADSTSASWLLRLCIPLWLVYVSNQWSRSSLYYLVDFSNNARPYNAMNVALDFDQAQYGVLASVAFTALFAVASLGAGVASDRFNRKTMTILSCLCWAAATLGTAWSISYTQVVLCRIAMGLACAFSTPTAYTLIRDRVPVTNQAFASSLYGTGVAVASALAALTILLDTEFGWSNALRIVATFGLSAAVICGLVLRDDPKEAKEEDVEPEKVMATITTTTTTTNESIWADVQEVVATRRVQWIFCGSFLRFCSGLCIGVWGAPYFRMVFVDQQSDYAVAQAAISAIGASLSGLLGGAAADWLATATSGTTAGNTDLVGRRLWVPVVGSILAAPTWYFAVHSEQSFEIAMAWLAAEYFVAECWFGPTISTLQATVGKRIGGTAQGLFTVTGAVANIAPSVLGFLYGQVTTAASGAASSSSSSMELANLLAIGVGFGYLSSAACFAIAAQSTPSSSSPTALEKAKST